MASSFRRCDFQLPPPLNDRFRTFLGVFFISVVSAFIILSMAKREWASHSLIGFPGFVFWGFHFHALLEFPIFTTLHLFSLSFSPGSFSIHNVFPPQKPQKPDASVEESTTVLKRVFIVTRILLFRSILCWSHFLQTLSTHKMLRSVGDIYEEGLKQILPGTFTIIIK